MALSISFWGVFCVFLMNLTSVSIGCVLSQNASTRYFLLLKYVRNSQMFVSASFLNVSASSSRLALSKVW